MSFTLGRRHATLEAPDERALDACVLAWQDAMLSELELWRKNPAGIPTKVSGCSGTRVVPLLPSWLPNAPVDPGNVLLEFRSSRFQSGSRWLAHVEARISDRSRPELPEGETYH